jgi:hypothetical protein
MLVYYSRFSVLWPICLISLNLAMSASFFVEKDMLPAVGGKSYLSVTNDSLIIADQRLTARCIKTLQSMAGV